MINFVVFKNWHNFVSFVAVCDFAADRRRLFAQLIARRCLQAEQGSSAERRTSEGADGQTFLRCSISGGDADKQWSSPLDFDTQKAKQVFKPTFLNISILFHASNQDFPLGFPQMVGCKIVPHILRFNNIR